LLRPRSQHIQRYPRTHTYGDVHATVLQCRAVVPRDPSRCAGLAPHDLSSGPHDNAKQLKFAGIRPPGFFPTSMPMPLSVEEQSPASWLFRDAGIPGRIPELLWIPTSDVLANFALAQLHDPYCKANGFRLGSRGSGRRLAESSQLALAMGASTCGRKRDPYRKASGFRLGSLGSGRRPAESSQLALAIDPYRRASGSLGQAADPRSHPNWLWPWKQVLLGGSRLLFERTVLQPCRKI
jgi:hypothetical protein